MAEHPAITNLRTNQRQLDLDGVEVGVSRQAVGEALDQINRYRSALRLIENHELRDHEDYEAIQAIASDALHET